MKIFRKLGEVCFAKPTSKEIAVADLEEARRQLIKSIQASNYHQRMVDYYYAVIAELQEQIK